MSERLVKNDDMPEGEGWFYFPEFGAAAVPIDAPSVVALNSAGVPAYHSHGPAIVDADKRRQAARAAFLADVAKVVPASPGANSGPYQITLTGTATPPQ